MEQNSLLENESTERNSGPIECLGLTFENDEARRAHFTKLLAEKLKDPEFRKIEGFPIGTDEAILELSDPPFYTACPNPWLNDFISLWESQKEGADDDYHREPFAADVSEGKNDPIYNAHSYHTKVPHKAIMRYILHYTNPGDIVFDGFCGTGMAGIAAQMCGDKNQLLDMGFGVDTHGNIYEQISDVGKSDKIISTVGKRNCVLNDLSPAATFIASSCNSELDFETFKANIDSILEESTNELSWMYKTTHKNGEICDVNFYVWSDVFICPECTEEIVFWDSAVSVEKQKALDVFNCSNCHAEVSKRNATRAQHTVVDELTNEASKMAKEKLVLINYNYAGKRHEKAPSDFDVELVNRIQDYKINSWVPSSIIEEGFNTRQPKVSHGIERVHQFYTKRNLIALSHVWTKLKQHPWSYRSWFTSTLSWVGRELRLHLGNYFGGGGGVITSLRGTLYVASLSVETNVFSRLKLRTRWQSYRSNLKNGVVCTETGSAAAVSLKDNSVDYIFIDPPFGANLNYSELNVLMEGWLDVLTDKTPEAIENKFQKKGIDEYRSLMNQSFKKAYKVLKPGRWITIEFSNTKASVWNNIQIALNDAGFVVSNVSALDKKKGSFKAVTTSTAVKQDLVISAYKPSTEFENRFITEEPVDAVWDFVELHLSKLLVIKYQDNQVQKVPERDPRIIFDRLISFFITHRKEIPLNSQEFQTQLSNRFPERDGMYFLPSQVLEYDKQRAKASLNNQFSIFVDDEASAIDWLRNELRAKPKTYSDIHPLFINELSGWKKNELQLELSTLLEENFIKYDGKEDVPNQIHTYLSTNFKDMRGLAKDDPALVAKAKDRWYVPDPNKAGDLEKIRLRALLREFEVYKAEKKKIKQPRAEALRAGFNHYWENQDLQTILDISAKIPPTVLQEDEKLLMFYDNAVTLTSNTDDDWG